ncbi:hypothetical protein ACPC54_39835 [Kitasatospora sp. NPDC094028]
MLRIACHFPITVSVEGTPSAADLEQLGRAVEAAVAERVGEARREVARLAAQQPGAAGPAAPPREPPAEPADRARIGEGGRTYLVPSYDLGGALRPVTLRTIVSEIRGIQAEATDLALRYTASRAGGVLGEIAAAFALGERGFRFLVAPSGPGAHRDNAPGFDSVAFNPVSGEIWLIDNKASGALGTLPGGTALGRNLRPGMEQAVRLVRAVPDFPGKADVVRRLEAGLDAVRAGKPIPAELKVRLKVTNAGGYGSGVHDLPPGAEAEDVVGPEVRAARERDVAKAEERGEKPGRPRSHAETERMRQQVGGPQSRQPAPVGAKGATGAGGLAAGAGTVGRGIVQGGVVVLGGAALVTAGALTILGALAALAKRKGPDTDALKQLTELRLRALRPQITARLDALTDQVADLQLSRPGRPLYGVIGLVTTVYRAAGGEERLIDCRIELASVSVGPEPVERSESSRVWEGKWYTLQTLRESVRTTYSVELAPLAPERLREALARRIAAEEARLGASSATPEELLASQRRRDELALAPERAREELLRRIAAEEAFVATSSATPEQQLAAQRRRDELLLRLIGLETP